MSDSQGGRANEHGEKIRDAVAALLHGHGFENVGPVKVNLDHTDPLKAFREAILGNLYKPTRVFAEDVPVCYHFHGSPFRVPFLLYVRGWPAALALMVREQNSSGSILEKLEFLYANIHERFPERLRAIVLLDGPMFTEPVLTRGNVWVSRSNGRIARIIHGLSELRVWLTDGCIYPPPMEKLLIA